MTPLPRDSAIGHVLTATRRPLRVDPDDDASSYDLMPSAAAGWIRGCAASVIVPALGPGTEVMGLIAVRRRRNDRTMTSLDLVFLEALGASVGVVLDRLRVSQRRDIARADAPPAVECSRCGTVDDRLVCGCGAPPHRAPAPRVLAGKYELRRRIGAGGMGVVYRARDLDLGRDVAVKTLPESSVEGLARLKEEARTMAAVAHPAIAQIHALETWRGRPLMVVEYMAGGTLADCLTAEKTLPPKRALRLAVDMTRAVGVLHDAGYLHCDIKPSNIAFDSAGAIKLLDFGLARLVDIGEDTGGGTLPYMSPLRLEGRPATEADDVWSLTIVIQEMLTGHNPFLGGGPDLVAGRIASRALPSPPTGASAPRQAVHQLLTSVLAEFDRPGGWTASALARRLETLTHLFGSGRSDVLPSDIADVTSDERKE